MSTAQQAAQGLMPQMVDTQRQDFPVMAQQNPVLAMIERAARDPAVDMDKMERLLLMKERAEAREAEAAFNIAMREAQTRIGTIGTNKRNSQTNSSYATYEKLNKAVRPIYTSAGFSLSFDTGEGAPAGEVRVLCYVAHVGGHSRTYHADIPADGKGAKGGDVMTRTHALGSGISYGKRYLLGMIFNIAIGEKDDDGNAATSKKGDTGKPRDGMRLEDMPEDRQIVIREHFTVISDFAESGGIDKAAAAFRDCGLPSEERIALWGLLPSHHRTAMNRVLKR